LQNSSCGKSLTDDGQQAGVARIRDEENGGGGCGRGKRIAERETKHFPALAQLRGPVPVCWLLVADDCQRLPAKTNNLCSTTISSAEHEVGS